MVKIPFPIGPNALAIIIVDKKVKTAAKNRLEKVMAMFLVNDDINFKLSTYHTIKIR